MTMQRLVAPSNWQFFYFFVTHTDHSTNPVIIIGDESFGFKAVEFANIT